MGAKPITAGLLTFAVGVINIAFSFAGAVAVCRQFNIPISYFMLVFFIIFFSIAWALDRLSGGALSRAIGLGFE